MLFARDYRGRGRLLVSGPDRARFLHGLVTNDIQVLQPGQGCRAALLSIKGKLVGDLRIYCLEESLLLELDAEALAPVRQLFESHLIMDDVTIADSPTGEWGIYGDEAAARLGELAPLPLHHHVERAGLRIAATREFGQPGFRLFGDHHPVDAPLLPDVEAEILRVEAGEPRFGLDMGPDHLPIESRLDEAISFTKGCYLGQEVIVRVTQQGRINRKLMGLRLAGDHPAERGATLCSPERAGAGSVTSSVVSPRFGPIALAYLHRTVWQPGTPLTLQEAADQRTAIVADLPFAI